MSLWDKLCVWRSTAKAGSKVEGRVYVVDANSLASANGKRARMAPRAQLDMLRSLSRFAKKENIDLFTIFEGKALRKVPDKTDYEGVHVRFAGKSTEITEFTLKILKDQLRRKEVVVITSDHELEKAVMDNGGVTMRSSTFSKALDSGPGGDRDGSSRGGRQGGRRRPRRRRGGSSRQSERREPKNERSGEDDEYADVRDLIDVVDAAPRTLKMGYEDPEDDDVEELDDDFGNQEPEEEPEAEDIDGNR